MAQLCQHREELARLNVAVLLVSFGPREKAGEWLAEICPAFQLLIDEEFRIYRAYRLRHSWVRSLSLNTMMYYIRAFIGGRKYRGIIGDPAQLGGYFIIDRDGSFLLEYRSKETTDRPPVSKLMDFLK